MRLPKSSSAGVDRYLAALAAVADSTPLAQEAAAVCRPTRRQGRRCRALNPFGEADAQLLLAVNRGEFAANGLRNRDLRAHGLIRKVSKTHRYVLTDDGRRIITALLTARQASTDKLIALAA